MRAAHSELGDEAACDNKLWKWSISSIHSTAFDRVVQEAVQIKLSMARKGEEI